MFLFGLLNTTNIWTDLNGDAIYKKCISYLQKYSTKHYKSSRPNPKIKEAATIVLKESEIKFDELHSSSEQ